MKIILKKEDERKLETISDKLSTIASVKMVEEQQPVRNPKAQGIGLVKPGAGGEKLLKKNVNTFIMILIIILICAGVGISVLYMNVIKDVSGEKDSLKENYSSCRSALENYMDVLSMTEQELNSTSEDIKKYDTLYEEKASLLENVQNDLQKTSTELTSTKSLLNKATDNLKKATQSLANVTSERDSLRTQVDKLKADNAKLELLVDNLQDDLEDCE